MKNIVFVCSKKIDFSNMSMPSFHYSEENSKSFNWSNSKEGIFVSQAQYISEFYTSDMSETKAILQYFGSLSGLVYYAISFFRFDTLQSFINQIKPRETTLIDNDFGKIFTIPEVLKMTKEEELFVKGKGDVF